ncbi:MAG: hypothetical protein ACE5R6_18450 [Candidatus Heimdallarchaeota archaeon]
MWIALISQFVKSIKYMQIKYDAYIEGFSALERKIGPLPIFSLADKLSWPYRTLRYKYMFNEFINFFFQLFGVLPRMLDEDIWAQRTEAENKQAKQRGQEEVQGLQEEVGTRTPMADSRESRYLGCTISLSRECRRSTKLILPRMGNTV